MPGYVKIFTRALLRITLIAALLLPIVGVTAASATSGWYNAGWQYRKLITLDHDKIPANLTNFPVLINLSTDGDLAGDAQNDGDDILFTSSDGVSKLNHEIEEFDGASGKLIAWVKVPALSSTSDTNIYMYYGNASAGIQENISAAWDANYEGVWHLSEDPSGTDPQMLDSTTNDHDGSAQGSWTPADQVPGLIDGSLDYDSGVDKLYTGKWDVVGGGGNDGITLETWFNSRDDNDGRFISKATSTDSNNHWWMLNALKEQNKYRLRFRLKTGTTTTELLAPKANPVPLNQWVYAASTYDGSTMRIYQDATEVANTSKSGTIATDSNVRVAIGNQPPYAGDKRFDGLITEVRVSNIARSPEWIDTSYNNYM
ncbi:DUF2341 domain-containing protein, partial [Chloroflexota bacterium]